MRYLPLLLILAGCAVKADDKPAAPEKRETYTAAVQRFERTVAGLAETQGNTNAEMEALRTTLGTKIDAVDARLGKIEGLLSVDTEISIEVPKAADPPQLSESDSSLKVDAPPAEAERRQRIVYFNGKDWDVDGTIKANYRRMWSFPGSIDEHLADHGVKGFEGLDHETKRKLHSAIHEMELNPDPKSRPAVTKSRTVYRAPVVLPQNCPSGRCPNVQYGYQSTRPRLFGRR